jgi:hypothetical protein
MASSKPTAHRPDWTDRFLETIRSTGNVRLAADAAGIDRTTPYARAKRDATFAAAWAAANEDAVDILEAEARRRALSGSDALLAFLLRAHRPDRYGTSVAVKVDIRREAEAIASRTGRSVEDVLAEVERLAAEVEKKR